MNLKNQYIAVGAGIIVVALFFVFFGNLFFNKDTIQNNTMTDTNKTTNGAATAGSTTAPSELVIRDIVVGTGAEAVKGKTVSVNYVGTLLDGTKFDASQDHGKPIEFMLGVGKVIQGWDQGLLGMKVGGKRMLTIPPQMAYGDQDVGNGLIPANSTLVFEVELVGVK